MKQKRVLIIAYPFPPAGGAGVKRTLKFLKFLKGYEWERFVLTVHDGVHNALDETLHQEYDSEVKVFRSVTLESLFGKSQSSSKSQESDLGEQRGSRLCRFGMRRLRQNVKATVRTWLIPDAHILWLPSAVLRAVEVIRKQRIKVVYATGPTFTDHLVAIIAKAVTGVRVVIDFRDAWTRNPLYQSPHPARRWVEKRLEKLCVSGADVVISTTDGMTKDFRQRYPSMPERKFVTIHNGFDLEDWTSAMTSIPETPVGNADVKIVHTGRLGLERNPLPFLQALRSILDESPSLAGRIQALFAGVNLPFKDGRTIEEYVRQLRLSEVVRIQGFVSRRESLAMQRAADLLLVVVGVVSQEFLEVYGLSGKVFDYVLAARPILAVSQDGATARFLKECTEAKIVDPSDITGIKNVLLSVIRAKQRGDCRHLRPRTTLAEYDFQNLTGKLSDVLVGEAPTGQ